MNKTSKSKEAEYPLIPMSEIRDEPRRLAVAWHESATDWIGDKHKLASDIQNYAEWQSAILQSRITQLETEKAQAEGEIERLKQALNQDKTGLAKGLSDIRKTLDAYQWICEGRGPYAWNDDRYKGEVLTMLTELDKIAQKALIESGHLATKAIHFKPKALNK